MEIFHKLWRLTCVVTTMAAVTSVHQMAQGVQGELVTLPGIANSFGSVCNNNNTIVNCPSNSQIALTSAFHGFEVTDAPCTPEEKNGDCLQSDNEEHESLSGKEHGTYSCADTNPTSCNASNLNSVSSYCSMSYQCVQNSDVIQMCDSRTINDREMVYLQSRPYTISGILPSDTACSCSVEANKFTDIHLFIIEMNLNMTSGDCKQNITIANRSDDLRSFQCQHLGYNFISKTTIPSTYLNISMINTLTVAGGKFWLGFQASDDNGNISVSCPSKKQTLFLDCQVPDNTMYTQVEISGTSYLSTLTYKCVSGYSPVSGNVTRICQENATWTGDPLHCLYECHEPPIPDGGNRSFTGTVTGAIAYFFCYDSRILVGDIVRHCVDGLGWNGTESKCCRDCGQPDVPDGGDVTISGCLFPSRTATYTCRRGYTLNGISQRTCTRDGVWDGATPECRKETFDYKTILIVVGALIAVGVVVGVWYKLWRGGRFKTCILDIWATVCHKHSHHDAMSRSKPSKQTDNTQEDLKEDGNMFATSVTPIYESILTRGCDADGGYEELGRATRDQVKENSNMFSTSVNPTYDNTVCDTYGGYGEPRPANRDQVKENSNMFATSVNPTYGLNVTRDYDADVGYEEPRRATRDQVKNTNSERSGGMPANDILLNNRPSHVSAAETNTIDGKDEDHVGTYADDDIDGSTKAANGTQNNVQDQNGK